MDTVLHIPTALEGVEFLAKGIPPPSNVYIGKDDCLFVTTYASLAALEVSIRARVLLANGRSTLVEFAQVPNSNRTANTTLLPLGEGFLLNLSAFLSSGTAKRGQCYVVIGLANGKESSHFKHTIIAQGYVGTAINQAWPGNKLEHPLEGPGCIRRIAGTNPAAGSEVIETVPTGARWRIIGFKASLTTSATVANRRMRFFYYDAAAGIILIPSPIVQPASVNYTYHLAPGMAFDAAPDVTAIQVGIGGSVVLPANATYGTNTLLIDAADDYFTPQTYVEEWIEP